MRDVFILLIIFQIKHFLADYPLQTPYMLRKFLPGKEFIKPLACHAGVHALFTFLICSIYGFNTLPPGIALNLAIVDFVIHFVQDRIKASPKMLGRYKALSASEFSTATDKQKQENKYFWWALGQDQMVHHLTHYLIIYYLVTRY